MASMGKVSASYKVITCPVEEAEAGHGYYCSQCGVRKFKHSMVYYMGGTTWLGERHALELGRIW